MQKLLYPVIILSMLTLVSNVSAEEKSPKEEADTLAFDLDEVIVSAQKAPVSLADARRSVQVIDRQQIEASPAQDLAGLLSSLRSVDIRSRGTYGMQADINIRGGTFDQTLVLLNGVNVTDPQTGHHNLNIPVDLQSVERIEVLHGSGARVFGPNAFNGAINIITKEPGDSHLNLSLMGGEHRLGAAGVSAGFSSGPVTHHVSAHGIRSDGFTENTDFQSGNLFYRSQIDFDAGDLDLQAGYNEKEFGANSFYTPVYPDQFEETRAGYASVRWLPANDLNLEPTVYWRRHHDRFELFRDDAPDWYGGHNYHRTDILGAAMQWDHQSEWGTTSAGLDYRYEHIFSNVLGEEMGEPMAVPGYDDAQFTHSYDRSGLSLMLEQNAAYGPFSMSAGTLIYSNTDLDEPFTLFPGLDLGWQILDDLRWYATANRTLRLPTFTDLFYSDPENQGNPDLQPERAISAETGFKSTWQNILFDVAVFRRWGRDMIDWVRSPGDEVWQAKNLTEVTISGFEAGAHIPLGVRIEGQAAPRSLSVQYSYIHADTFSGDQISNYALDHLNHKVDATLTHPVTRQGGVSVTGSWQDRAGSYMLFEDGEFTDTEEFEPFFMVDLKLFYEIGPAKIFTEASNALDTQRVDIANVPQPGRWIRGGVQLRL